MIKVILIGYKKHNQVCRMPVDEVKAAVSFVDSDIMEICSNHPDFVSTAYYLCDKKGIKCVLKYKGKRLSGLDEAFGIFNECYAVMDKICEGSAEFEEPI